MRPLSPSRAEFLTWRSRLRAVQALHGATGLPEQALDDSNFLSCNNRAELHEMLCGPRRNNGEEPLAKGPFQHVNAIQQQIDQARNRLLASSGIRLSRDYRLKGGKLLGMFFARHFDTGMPLPPCYLWLDIRFRHLQAWVPESMQPLYQDHIQSVPLGPGRQCLWYDPTLKYLDTRYHPLFLPARQPHEWYDICVYYTCELSLKWHLQLDLLHGLLRMTHPIECQLSLSPAECWSWQHLFEAASFWNLREAFAGQLDAHPWPLSLRWEISGWKNQTYQQATVSRDPAAGQPLQELLASLQQVVNKATQPT